MPLLAFLPLAFSSTIVQAQQSAYAVSIEGFDVEPAAQLSAGNNLLFTLCGSAGGTATVRIDRVVDKFPLEEVETGVYEGTYTIKDRDRGGLKSGRQGQGGERDAGAEFVNAMMRGRKYFAFSVR